MPFDSVPFLFLFLPGVLLVTLVWSKLWPAGLGTVAGNLFLVLVSLFFYAWAGPKGVWVLLASTAFNYGVGLLLRAFSKRAWQTLWLVTGVLANLGLLVACKYFPECLGLASNLPSALHPGRDALARLTVPLGISFYTLKGIAYLVDVFRGAVTATADLVGFGCFYTLFPQLLAGPIVRYQEIAPQLGRRGPGLADCSEGASRLIMGLAKKLLLADTLGRVATAAFGTPVRELSWLAAWGGVFCYALQIYYDWCGYSDMAIGLGRMLGFSFPENFAHPYGAGSLREFWSRWNMTLTGWLEEYVGRPLAGAAPSWPAAAGTTLVVFLLFGVWHGVSWNFIAWGFFNGCFLVVESAFPAFFAPGRHRAFRQVYTLLAVLVGWVIFRTSSLTQALDYLWAMAGGYAMGVQSNWVWLHLFAADTYLVFGLGCMLALPLYPRLRRRALAAAPVLAATAEKTWLLCMLVLSLFALFGADPTTFLAFTF